ncbi:MAG: hypothetical protein DRP09_19480, partial [Candidatus Thorarchaeota archaeon]
QQIRRIRTLRKRLRIKNKYFLPILDELIGEQSFARMTKADADVLISFLQPENWEEITKHLEAAKEGVIKEKVEAVKGLRFKTSYPHLEEKFGVLTEMSRTAEEIENIAKTMKKLPPIKEKKPLSILGGLAPYLSEDLGAKVTGIKESFHTPMRAIINLGNRFKNRMLASTKKVFADLSDKEKKELVFAQAGGPEPKSKKLKERAKYLQEVFTAHLAIINAIRKARGLPPIKGRKPYIPYIIDQNIAAAASLFEGNKFWEERTKTFAEFKAGLFTHDPERIMKIWAESASSWLKKNLFSAFLYDRYQELGKINTQASNYGRMLVEMDIYNMLPPREKLFRSIGWAINQRLGSIFPKKIPVSEDLANALKNTTFGKDLVKDLENGYITVPWIQLPNAGAMFHAVFYPAKLAWNFGFAILNRQQPWSAIPFIGTKESILARIKMYSAFLPWNKKMRENYYKILGEGGYLYGRYAAGEEIAFTNRAVNFLSDITEAMNRVENAIGAELFLNEAEGKVGKKLSKKDRDLIIANFSAFINFLSGKGYSPVAQRSTLGRIAYTFQQYPINQLNVYHEMYKAAIKDKGVAEFFKMLAQEGGASDKALEFFDKLPDKSKASVFRILLAIVLPVAIMYAISRNWNVASRALPGIPRASFFDLARVVSDFLEDPSKGKDALIDEIKKLSNVTAIKRLADAIDAYQTGIIQRGGSGHPVFVEKGEIPNLLMFGRSSLKEYTKQYPSLLERLFGKGGPAIETERLYQERTKQRREDTNTAVKFLKDYSKAKTPADKAKVLKEYREKGLLTPSVMKKIEQFR